MKTSFSVTAALIAGEVVPGTEFTAFDTHHQVSLTVCSALSDGANLRLVCETDSSLHSEQFVGAILDSAGSKRGTHFFYDIDNKFGPNGFDS